MDAAMACVEGCGISGPRWLLEVLLELGLEETRPLNDVEDEAR